MQYRLHDYTESEKERFDELVVDIYNKYYEYNPDQKEELLWKNQEANVPEFYVEQDFFDDYWQKIRDLYIGDWNVADAYDFKEVQTEKKKPLVPKEKIWQAIKWELDESEFDRIISFNYKYPKDDYYNFDLIMEKIHALMKGEKSISYFKSWCILLMRCYMDNMKYRSKKLLKIFYDLGDYFDGVAFMDSSLEGEEKLKECREIIAALKDYNHRICDLKNRAETDFTTNGVITYVAFAFTLNDGEESLYRVCVVDEEKRTINYLFVEDIDYLEEINYTLLSQAEFDDLSSDYWEGYTLDTSMPADYAIRKTKRSKQKC
ncbi:MAG: hypothetical protein K2L02_02255 [Clostridia bacterium]|nr:hypothetical protein [Clostridia bacterium]